MKSVVLLAMSALLAACASSSSGTLSHQGNQINVESLGFAIELNEGYQYLGEYSLDGYSKYNNSPRGTKLGGAVMVFNQPDTGHFFVVSDTLCKGQRCYIEPSSDVPQSFEGETLVDMAGRQFFRQIYNRIDLQIDAENTDGFIQMVADNSSEKAYAQLVHAYCVDGYVTASRKKSVRILSFSPCKDASDNPEAVFKIRSL